MLLIYINGKCLFRDSDTSILIRFSISFQPLSSNSFVGLMADGVSASIC